MKKIFNLVLIVLLLTVMFTQSLTISAKNDDKKRNPNVFQEKSTNSKKQIPQITPTSIPINTSDSLEFKFNVEKINLPDATQVNSQLQPKITLTNTSNQIWKKEEVEISYHWIDRNGQFEIYRGDTTKLKKDLAPGGTIEQDIQTKAPSIPGVFDFSFDLLKGGKWFTENGSSRFLKGVSVKGNVNLSDEDRGMLINDGAQFANSANLTLEVTSFQNQPGSDSAAFIYDFAQTTDASPESIRNGNAMWSTWELMSYPWDKSKIKATLTDESVGVKRIYVRYRAIKKHSDATPLSYGSAMYHYGRSEKTTGAYFADEIFFDNVPPVGSILINNGASSTSSSLVSLKISATDTVNGIEGSGLEAMRLAANCGIWGEWEAYAESKTGFDLGSGNILSVCVQFRDKAGNISEGYKDEILLIKPANLPAGGNIGTVLGIGDGPIGVGIGTHDSPFANLTSNDLQTPDIEFDRFINIFGTEKWNQVKRYSIPMPVITYVERDTSNTNQIKVYGIGIKKYNPVKVKVNNEYRHFWLGPSGWENKEADRTIDNVKVEIYNKTKNNIRLAELWNDDSEGKWQTQLTIGQNLDDGDEIFAQVYIYQEFEFDDLKWWSNTKENDVKFNASNLASQSSTPLKIPPTRSQLLIEKIQSFYNVSLKEDGVTWTEFDLNNIGLGLYYVPKSFYDQGNMVIIKQATVGSGVNTTYTNSCLDFGNGSFVGGYVRSSEPNNVYFCALGTATGDIDLSFQGTVIHEFAHNWQRRVSSMDTKYGKNIINDTDHILYKYYDILFNAKNGEWILDTSIVNSGVMPSQCSRFREGLPGEEVAWPIFVTRYSCQTTYNLSELTPTPPYTMPEEEMAETIKIYYLNKQYLITKDSYNYTVGTNIISGNLSRKEFIEQNVK